LPFALSDAVQHITISFGEININYKQNMVDLRQKVLSVSSNTWGCNFFFGGGCGGAVL